MAADDHTDIKHRPLSSLTPDEARDVAGLLSLLGMSVDNLGDESSNHVVLKGAQRRIHNGLRIPTSSTVNDVIVWARLLNQAEEL